MSSVYAQYWTAKLTSLLTTMTTTQNTINPHIHRINRNFLYHIKHVNLSSLALIRTPSGPTWICATKSRLLKVLGAESTLTNVYENWISCPLNGPTSDFPVYQQYSTWCPFFFGSLRCLYLSWKTHHGITMWYIYYLTYTSANSQATASFQGPSTLLLRYLQTSMVKNHVTST
jgi:hypothetical protein